MPPNSRTNAIRIGAAEAASTWPLERVVMTQLWSGDPASEWIRLWSEGLALAAARNKIKAVSKTAEADLMNLFCLITPVTIRDLLALKHSALAIASTISAGRKSRVAR